MTRLGSTWSHAFFESPEAFATRPASHRHCAMRSNDPRDRGSVPWFRNSWNPLTAGVHCSGMRIIMLRNTPNPKLP